MKNATKSRRFGWITLAAGLAALAVYFGSRVLLERPDLPARLPIALAPLPFFVLFVLAFLRLVREMDELERRVQLEALAFAYPALLLLIMTLGLLELAGVALSPADWSFRHVWQIAVVLYVGGIALASRRYGLTR
jgi:hypothetical protein